MTIVSLLISTMPIRTASRKAIMGKVRRRKLTERTRQIFVMSCFCLFRLDSYGPVLDEVLAPNETLVICVLVPCAVPGSTAVSEEVPAGCFIASGEVLRSALSSDESPGLTLISDVVPGFTLALDEVPGLKPVSDEVSGSTFASDEVPDSTLMSGKVPGSTLISDEVVGCVLAPHKIPVNCTVMSDGVPGSTLV